MYWHHWSYIRVWREFGVLDAEEKDWDDKGEVGESRGKFVPPPVQFAGEQRG